MEVIEVAAANDGSGGRQRGGSRVGAGETDDLVPGGKDLGDSCGTDVAGGAGDKYAHGESSLYEPLKFISETHPGHTNGRRLPVPI
jgi:hypothetical protein